MEGVEIMMANQVWRLGGGRGGDKWDRGEMEVEGEMEKGWREWREVGWERGVGWEWFIIFVCRERDIPCSRQT